MTSACFKRLSHPRKVLPEVEFANDIKGYLRQLRERETSEVMEVVNVDDFNNLLMSGSAVLGSCQRVSGDCEKNKCLVAYMVDGKNRMLVVRLVGTDRMEARCMFRLLFKEDGGLALFEDRVYPAPCDPAYVRALRNQVLAEARRMGLPLYTCNGEDGVVGEAVPLHSLGSFAPFEYADAAGGVTEGIFTVKGARLVVS